MQTVYWLVVVDNTIQPGNPGYFLRYLLSKPTVQGQADLIRDVAIDALTQVGAWREYFRAEWVIGIEGEGPPPLDKNTKTVTAW